MKPEPLIIPSDEKVIAEGQSFSVYEWRGSGPGYLHVHHTDDEAWHVLEGVLHFRFQDKEIDAVAGATVFVPAGVPHDYEAQENTRYLITLTPRLSALIKELQQTTRDEHQLVMRRYQSEIIE